MNNLLSKVDRLKEDLPFLQGQNFLTAQSGTHHSVIISEKFVIRSRDDNPHFLVRETEFLKQFTHKLIPQVVWSGIIEGSFLMIENRLSGTTLDQIWKEISKIDQEHIIQQLILFLKYLREQAVKKIYSVQTGKEYPTFFKLITGGVKRKIDRVKQFSTTADILGDIRRMLGASENKTIFSNQKIAIVHGDLINHNLLVDKDQLTGVLDWELALRGDSDYDLCRLFYYQECAKAYQEQGVDYSYETDYMDRLIAAIEKSNLITDGELFKKKYSFMRAVFYLNALYWASSSDESKKNLQELITLWNKKGGAKH